MLFMEDADKEQSAGAKSLQISMSHTFVELRAQPGNGLCQRTVNFVFKKSEIREMDIDMR